MKHNNLVHPAVSRYEQMKGHFDPSPIIAFATRDGYVEDEAVAPAAMDAVMQWLAGHAVERHEQPYVMMNGLVDNMYHAFMLSTRSYLHFCRDHVGFFIHHTPLDAESMQEPTILSGIDYTLDYLASAFGGDLADPLCEWGRLHEQGLLQATSVSCVGNGYDDVHSQLVGISDFGSFWDHEEGLRGTA